MPGAPTAFNHGIHRVRNVLSGNVGYRLFDLPHHVCPANSRLLLPWRLLSCPAESNEMDYAWPALGVGDEISESLGRISLRKYVALLTR